MQKKLLAVLVGGMLASSAALADTANVNVYGVADLTLDFVKAAGATTSGDNIGNFTRISANSSYLGFKGSDDIGGGLKGLFQIEMGVPIDSAAALTLGRDSYVGLGGDFGTLTLGNISGPSRVLYVMTDVHAGATGIGNSSGLTGKLGNSVLGANGADSSITLTLTGVTPCGRSATCASLSDSRFKNALQYASPNMGGFIVTGLYSANENSTRDGVAGTATEADTKLFDVGARFASGPFMVGVTYLNADLGNLRGTELTGIRVGGTFAVGPVSIRGLVEKMESENLVVAGDKYEQDVFGLGVIFSLTPNTKLLAQHYIAKDVDDAAGAITNTGATLSSLGVEHSLSKRTLIKAGYAILDNDDGMNYDFGVNSVGIGAGGGGNGDGAKLSGLYAGVRTTF